MKKIKLGLICLTLLLFTFAIVSEGNYLSDKVLANNEISAEEVSSFGDDCARREFKTEMYKKACMKGGQREAKKVAKHKLRDFRKKAGHRVTCNTCHTKLKPDYPLKDDALKNYKDWGGK